MKISVIVTKGRRDHLLLRCLKSLYNQALPAEEYEILVIDRRAVFENESTPRQKVWQVSQGEYLAFIDDDCIAAYDWLEKGLEAFNESVQAVAGRILVPLSRESLAVSQFKSRAFGSANTFIRRSLLKKGRTKIGACFAPRVVVIRPEEANRWIKFPPLENILMSFSSIRRQLGYRIN